MSAGGPRWAWAADVGVVVRDEATYAARLPDGPIVVLDPVAATIVAAATEAGVEVVAAVARAFGRTPGEVAAGVASTLDRLATAGILARHPAQPDEPRVSDARRPAAAEPPAAPTP